MFVNGVAESDRAADCDSEDFGEAGESGVVAFAVFGGGRFVVGGYGLVASAGGLRESASSSGCGCPLAS